MTTARQFAELFERGESLIERVAGRGETLFNTLGVSRADVVETEGGTLVATESAAFSTAVAITPTDRVTLDKTTDGFVLANDQLRAVFSRTGRLTSLMHLRSGREALSGEGNVLELYDDVPTQFDAWDIDPLHLETRREVGAANAADVVRTDALRGEIRFSYSIGKRSTLTQIVRLDAGAESLVFFFDVDWHEDQTLLKVAFPVNARAMNATYEMQFGYAERPTHYNTSFDLARYEVPFHRWFDLSEPGFGVAILSERKYGASTFDQTMRVSLLRAPMSPDPTCDRGRHQFSIAILPHAGDWREAGVVGAAMAFNQPLRKLNRLSGLPLITCDSDDLIVDTIKQAEDRSGDLIVRLYECHGRRGRATVRFGTEFSRVSFCNALEDITGTAKTSGDTIEIAYEPHRICTLRLTRS